MTLTKRTLFTTLIAFICAIATSVLLAGCATSALQIGNESDETVIVATNETGQAISSIAFKAEQDDAFGADLAQEADWANDAVADIHLGEAQLAAPEITAEDGSDDLIFNNLQTMRITTSDGMTYELHQLNLADIKDASICLEGDIAYLEYTSVNTGEVVSTLDAEKAYREQKAAEEAAAAQAKADAEKAEADKKAKASNTGSSSKSASASNASSPADKSNSGSPNASAPAPKPAPDEAEDECVDDLIFNE